MASLRIVILITLVVIIGNIEWSVSKRTKREVDLQSALCLYLCVADHWNHSAFESHHRDDGGSPICKHADLKQLEQICSIFGKGKSCIVNTCSSSPLKTMILDAVEYGCEKHYPEFQRYTPCFTDSCAYIENACRPRCGSAMEAIRYSPEEKRKLNEIRQFRNIMHHDSNTQKTDATNSEDSLADLDDTGTMDFLESLNLEGACRYINCYLNCSEGPLTQKCGADTYKFFRNVVADLTPMIFSGFFSNITSPPAECRKTLSLSHVDDTSTKSSWTLNPPSFSALAAILILTIYLTGRHFSG